jgi:hypothetical protein
MCLKGSSILYNANDAVEVKAVLKAIKALYVEAGRPYGPVCHVNVDWQTAMHLVPVDSCNKTVFISPCTSVTKSPRLNTKLRWQSLMS